MRALGRPILQNRFGEAVKEIYVYGNVFGWGAYSWVAGQLRYRPNKTSERNCLAGELQLRHPLGSHP